MMKKLKNIISLIILGFGCSVFAAATTTTTEKVVITGEPIVLQQTGSGDAVMYTLPADAVSTTTTYHYVTVNGTNRVCYSSAQPNLGNIDMVTINVSSGGTTSPWYCYAADTTVFEIQPAGTTTTTTTSS
ncbi:Uncharacterised protein [Legionella beliardensis]|uniref:Secreted protein n=1 Tax=Legionella beliardensis TaxID=91822 RepID=A0A378I383_9GAMM|nr:hypothetical protein [Legionella beliardensis]STX29453.1 Uncharacterised protein [Legionella beliardensis]